MSLKYCTDPDNCTYADCPTAFCDRHGSKVQSFTFNEVMSALSEAFANTHPRSSQDCEVEAEFARILSARIHPSLRGAKMDESDCALAEREAL